MVIETRFLDGYSYSYVLPDQFLSKHATYCANCIRCLNLSYSHGRTAKLARCLAHQILCS